MSHCLVTGGAGFIGSHLTEYLLAQGHEVSVLDDLSTGREDNLRAVAGHPRLHVRTGSITDPILLAEVARSVEVIFHLRPPSVCAWSPTIRSARLKPISIRPKCC